MNSYICVLIIINAFFSFLLPTCQNPLHYAAVSGQGDVCLELLLKDGASPNLQVLYVFCTVLSQVQIGIHYAIS